MYCQIKLDIILFILIILLLLLYYLVIAMYSIQSDHLHVETPTLIV